VGPKNAKILFLYVTHPKKDIQGFAHFIERKIGDARELWKTLGHETLLKSYEEYQDFLQGRKKATFIRFRNLQELPNPVPTRILLQVIGKGRMPQMGLYLNEKTAHKLMLEEGAEIGGI
jgi:predicted transcriptional regulator